MTEEKFTYKYYIVGNRPVKIAIDDEGLKRGAYAINWKTGEFEIKHTYMSRIAKPGSNLEIENVDKETFDKAVKSIKDRKKTPRPKASGM